MNIQDWRIIQTLYTYKNITKTAKALYLSQPALTARIRKIEKYYDISLVVRHRRGVQFTSEGEYLAEWAPRILNQNELIKDNLNNMRREMTGTLRIGVSKFMAKYKMPEILRLFKRMYPLVEFQVLTGWSGDVYKQILNRDVHVAFVRGDYPWSEGKDLLFEERLCAAYTKPFTWDDLPHLPRIAYDTDPRLKNEVDNWWTEHYDVPAYTTIEVDQVDTCKEMIIHGLGYGILPCVIMKDYSDIYQKMLVDSKGDPLIRKTWLYYHEDVLEINMVNQFILFVKDIDVYGNEM